MVRCNRAAPGGERIIGHENVMHGAGSTGRTATVEPRWFEEANDRVVASATVFPA